jgi:Uma2 family endonuclease
MASQITRKLFTVDDCYKMSEVGILSPTERVELIGGEIILVSPPGPRHGAAVDRASRAFIKLVRDKAIVRTQGGVVLDRFAAPLPDLALLRPKADEYVAKNPGASDILLLVEVADSSLEFDTTVKLSMYAILGIREYWVADLAEDRLLVYSKPAGDSYQIEKELHRGNTIAPRALPHCRIAVDVFLP